MRTRVNDDGNRGIENKRRRGKKRIEEEKKMTENTKREGEI